MNAKKYFVIRCKYCGKFRAYSTKTRDFIPPGRTIKCFYCGKTHIPNSPNSVGYNVEVKGPYYSARQARDKVKELNARGKEL